MRKWILLLLGLVMMINLTIMGIGCKSKEPEKPAIKEEAKPPEAPAPAPPAEEKPAPTAPEKKK
jgi:hypothetical protein